MMTARLQRVGFVCGVVIGALVLLALMLVPGQVSRGQGLPPTPAANELGWRTYTTAAPQWRYDPASWVPLGDAVLSTSTANAQLTLTFLGNGVSLHYATSSDGGTFSAQIDDLLPETLDTRSAGGAAGDAVWSKAVDPGVHTLTVTHHTGTLRLKSVAVQGDLLDARPVSPTQAAATRPPQAITPQPPVAVASPVPSSSGWTTYQDTDPRLVYGDGTWQTFPVTRANGGTLTGTADAGASLTAYFQGSGIRVVYARGPEGRAFAARIDDALRQTGDAYGRAYSYGHTLTIEGLEHGLHTLTLTDNDGAIWIEAIQVQGRLLAPGDGIHSSGHLAWSGAPDHDGIQMFSLVVAEPLTFVQDFEGGEPGPGQAIAPYTFSGTPDALIGTPADSPALLSTGAVTRWTGPGAQQLVIQVDLALGDPAQTYRVVDFGVDVWWDINIDSYGTYYPHGLKVELKSPSGAVLSYAECYFDPITQGFLGWTQPFTVTEGVSLVTFRHFTNAPVSTDVNYHIALDNLVVYTERDVEITETPTPTLTETPAPTALPTCDPTVLGYATPTATPNGTPEAAQMNALAAENESDTDPLLPPYCIIPTATPTPGPIVVDTLEYEFPSIPDNDCSLGEALEAANSNQAVDGCSAGSESEADTIVLATNLNGQPLMLLSNPLDCANEVQGYSYICIGGPNGGGSAEDPLGVIIQGFQFIRPNTAPKGRILEIAPDYKVTLDNVTIIGGDTTNPGGGILNQGELHISESIVRKNRSETDGGGVFNAGHLEITDAIIERNIGGMNGRGGGVYNTATANAVISNSCIVFNTARTDGGIYAETPSNIDASVNWWGDQRGPSVQGYSLAGAGDIITPGIAFGSFLDQPPATLSEPCIDYSGLFLNSPDGVLGQPGLAGEVYVRARQILDRELTFEEMFAFTLKMASIDTLEDVEKIRLVEAVARVYYQQTSAPGLREECESEFNGLAHTMQHDEQINPRVNNPDPNTLLTESIPYILCGFGVTEWYGEIEWADNMAYKFADFIANENYQSLEVYALLITTTSENRLNEPYIGEQCYYWESGLANPCPYTWGNYRIFPAQAFSRMNHPDNVVDGQDVLNSTIYRTTDYQGFSDGAERGLDIRFATNGDEKTSSYVDSDFFIMTNNQRDVLYCGSSDQRRLFVAQGISGTTYPLCRDTKSSDASIIVDIPANN